jgi:hypothetical protein
MTTQLVAQEQARAEVKTYPLDFSPDLLTGVTVVSTTATLTAPDGSITTPTVVPATPFAYVTVGPLTQIGNYLLDVLATLSDSEISAIRLVIPVHY